jgi:hypothetical protein
MSRERTGKAASIPWENGATGNAAATAWSHVVSVGEGRKTSEMHAIGSKTPSATGSAASA